MLKLVSVRWTVSEEQLICGVASSIFVSGILLLLVFNDADDGKFMEKLLNCAAILVIAKEAAVFKLGCEAIVNHFMLLEGLLWIGASSSKEQE